MKLKEGKYYKTRGGEVLGPMRYIWHGGDCEWGYESFNDEYPEDQIIYTFRRGNINLIVTNSAENYGRWVTATIIAKKLNLLDKQDRIDLFQGVLYGNYEGLVK